MQGRVCPFGDRRLQVNFESRPMLHLLPVIILTDPPAPLETVKHPRLDFPHDTVFQIVVLHLELSGFSDTGSISDDWRGPPLGCRDAGLSHPDIWLRSDIFELWKCGKGYILCQFTPYQQLIVNCASGQSCEARKPLPWPERGFLVSNRETGRGHNRHRCCCCHFFTMA